MIMNHKNTRTNTNTLNKKRGLYTENAALVFLCPNKTYISVCFIHNNKHIFFAFKKKQPRTQFVCLFVYVFAKVQTHLSFTCCVIDLLYYCTGFVLAFLKYWNSFICFPNFYVLFSSACLVRSKLNICE